MRRGAAGAAGLAMRLAGLARAGGGGGALPEPERSLAHPGARREGRAPGAARGGRGSQAWVRSQGSEQPKASVRWAPAAVSARTGVPQIWSPRSECSPGWFLPGVSSWLAASPRVLTRPFLCEQRRALVSRALPPSPQPCLMAFGGLSSPTRDRTWALSTESQPLDSQAALSRLLMKPSSLWIRASTSAGP